MKNILLIRGALKGAPSGGHRAEGGGRATKSYGGWRTADREKFLLRFSNTPYKIENVSTLFDKLIRALGSTITLNFGN